MTRLLGMPINELCRFCPYFCGFRRHCKFLLKTVIFLIIFSVILISTSVFIHFQYFRRCSEEKGRNQIKIMCRLYHNKEIVGSMCSTLCDEEKVKYLHCAGNNNDKEVEIITCKGCEANGVISKLVLKSEYDMYKWDRGVKIQFLDKESIEAKARKMINEIVAKIKFHFQMDLSTDKNILYFFLGDNYTNVIQNLNKPNADKTVFRNVASLAAQVEFLAMKVFSNASFIPKTYGTCGPAYVVEYTPPLSALNYVLFQGKISEIIKLNQPLPSWSERAKIALRFLRHIRVIEHAFDRPIQLCDAPSDNFGLNNKGDITLPDLTQVLFERRLTKRCSSDAECNSFHCPGVCDVNGTHMCTFEVKETNLQVLCRTIFISHVRKFGLLRNPPREIANRLEDLIHRCAYTSPRLIRLPKDNYSDETMMREFEEILKDSLHMDSPWL